LEDYSEVTIDIRDSIALNLERFDSFEVRIEDFSSTEAIRVRTFADSRLLAHLPIVTALEDSWIDITIREETSHNLELQRIEADSEVSFAIVVIGTSIVTPADPTIAIVLAIVAIAPASLALYKACHLKGKLKLQEDEQYNSFSQQ
jgi:hypothetical protein